MRLVEAMEEWPYADDRVMQRSYTAEVCVACAWFCFGIDGYCHTSVGCALKQAQLQQGQHLPMAAATTVGKTPERSERRRRRQLPLVNRKTPF